ncbi:MAG TPA: RusA family crossover junction endodeoxyribonuclease [Streptosporangiaceae bacterium]|nr:RusA family crossover junction endodeoxyribonuclease [Streptosporangiaceae bacterium]
MIKITVDGRPAPQGSKVRNRYGAIYEDNRAVRPWRDAVRTEAQRAQRAEDGPMFGAVLVVIVFRLARPKGHYGTGRNAGTVRSSAPAHPSGKPDVDKLARAVLDGLTEGSAFKDDAQVVSLQVTKVYAERTGADITVSEVWA